MRLSPLHLGLLIASTVAFCATVIINAILSSNIARDVGVKESIGRVARDNPVDILPATWTFSIWLLIYLWQGLWITYAWVFVFRASAINSVNQWIHALFIISCGFNIAWLFLFGNEEFTGSFVVLLLLELTLDAMIGVASYTSYHQTQELIENGQKWDVILTQVFLNNGISVYETWVTIAVQVNFAVALQYDYDVSRSVASIVALCIILVELGGWFIAEITILDRFVRYTLIVYPVVVWSFAGIIANNYKEGEASSILAVVAICIACCVMVARFVLTIVYHLKRPLHTTVVVAVTEFEKSTA